VLTGNKQGIWCLNYSHDGKKLVSASSDGLCKIWDVKSGKCAQELTAHAGHKVSEINYSRGFSLFRLTTLAGMLTQL
jgi:WD40 repeat protein